MKTQIVIWDSVFSRCPKEKVMKKAMLVTSLLIIQILMLSCSGQAKQVKKDPLAAPSWIDTGGIDRFPSDLFITGVGSADVKYSDTAAAQAEADSKSIAQVAKQIEVVIQQLSSSFEREVSSGSGETLSQRNIWEKTAAYVKIKVDWIGWHKARIYPTRLPPSSRTRLPWPWKLKRARKVFKKCIDPWLLMVWL